MRLIIPLMLFALSVSALRAADLIVGPGGFVCIRDAVMAARSGDRILVQTTFGNCPSGGGTVFDRDLVIEAVGRSRVSFDDLFLASWDIRASVSFRGFDFEF